MKNLNMKHAVISSIVVYILGILAYVGSFFIPIMNDPELQANLVLMIAIVPAAILGARIYYKRGHTTSGFVLGFAMFLGAIILDAIITVPLFIIPNGGSHLSFFGDPGFWLIGVEYVITVAVYWQFKVVHITQSGQA
ncbi:MAG: hypothetical protein GVY20_17255 [Bacteroidetes bacterium]|jgi:hypothetical protein|nr:hypothetical protein [Bacteroidota bacterium]